MERPDFYPCSMLAWGQHVKGQTVDRVYTRKADGRVEILTAEFTNGALLDVMLGPYQPSGERTTALYFWATEPLDPPSVVMPPQPPPPQTIEELVAQIQGQEAVPVGPEANSAVVSDDAPEVDQELVNEIANLSADELMARLMKGEAVLGS